MHRHMKGSECTKEGNVFEKVLACFSFLLLETERERERGVFDGGQQESKRDTQGERRGGGSVTKLR